MEWICKKRMKKALVGSKDIALSLVLSFFMSFSVAASEKINYRLKWLFNASVIGDIYASEMGIFKKYGLDVEVKEGGPERDAIKELEMGYAQFGVASADQVVRALSKGSPVIVIAQLFQNNPLQWIYREDAASVRKLSDLKGKKIGVTFGGNDETIMKTLLAKGNVSERDVSLFSVRFDYTPFYQKKVDLWPLYINAQGPIIRRKLEEAKEKVAFLNPAEFGVRFVANSVVSSQRVMKENPKLVQTFRKALLEAWEESFRLENRDKSLNLLKRYDKNTPSAIVEEQFDLTRSLIKPAENLPIGKIDVAGWEQTESIMLKEKVVSNPVFVKKALLMDGSFF